MISKSSGVLRNNSENTESKSGGIISKINEPNLSRQTKIKNRASSNSY